MALNGPTVVIVEWVNLALTLGLIVFRQLLRYHLGKKFIWCDFFVVLAWISFLLQGSLDTVLWRLGLFEGKISSTAKNFGPKYGLATYEDTVLALKIIYIETVMYYNCMYCVKWSMLAFYEALIPRTMRRLRFAMWVTVALTIVGFVSTLFAKVFTCMKMWENATVGQKNCDPKHSAQSAFVRWVQHVVTDIMVYLLPLFLLKSLALKRIQKIGIAFTFFVGFICIFFACAENVANVMGADETIIWFFANLEQTWAIIVVCCPALRALFKIVERKLVERESTSPSGSKRRSAPGMTATQLFARSDGMVSGGGGHRRSADGASPTTSSVGAPSRSSTGGRKLSYVKDMTVDCESDRDKITDIENRGVKMQRDLYAAYEVDSEDEDEKGLVVAPKRCRVEKRVSDASSS